MRETISGAGPSGGGSSFSTRPDTLRSNDTFEGLLGLCAGPIKGPVRGLKSVRVNGTPIEDETGKLNFPDFTALFADGDPLKFPQIATLKLGAGGSPINIGTGLSNNAVSGNPWSTHTLTNLGANAVDLRFVVQQLYRQDKKGIYENTANLEIQMKPSGSTNWINPFNPNGNPMPAYSESGYSVDSSSGTVPGYLLKTMFPQETYNTMAARANSGATQYLTITGKTTSTYVRELRVRLPNTGAYANKSWDIRVRLVEADSVDADPNFEKRTISWESITAVYDGNLGNHEDWRGLAWLQIYGKASDNFNGLPEVDGIYDTKIVSVPPSSVYDPITRLYSGTIWDGSWAKSFTTDPAWIINDAISDPISGIAAFVPGARLNKWDALDLSKWASQLVPDGAGGMHPRYSLGIYVDQPQKADEFIRFLAGAVASTAWDDGDGEWRLKVDKPETPSAIFTHENVEGEIAYSHTDVDTRFNDVTVVFNNEEFDFAEDRVRVQDFANIDKVGRKPTKVVAVGCTNRQQALRWAILRLRTNINEFRVATFTTNRQGKILERFNQILIADGSLGVTLQGSKRTTGRIIANTGTTIQVRDPLRLEVGVAYKIHATIPNPAYQPAPTTAPADPTWSQPTLTVSRNIVNTSAQVGDVTTIYLDQAFPTSIAANANVALEAVGLPTIPKVYRVVDVAYDDDGERVSISAIEVDTGKWAASDNATEAAFDSDRAPSIAPPPTNLTFHLDTYVTDTQSRRVLNVQFQRPASRYTTSFNVRYRVNQGVWRFLDETSDTLIEVFDPEQGTYEFEVTANDRRGRVSNPLKGSYDVAAQIDLPPAAGLTNEAANIAADYQGNVTDFSQGVGRFFLNNTLGIISTGVTYNVKAGSATGGLAVTIDANGNYTPTALTADQGQVTLQAHYGPFTIEKVFTLSKSRAGQDGQAAKGFFLQSNTQTIPFTPAGAPVDGTQVITFTGIRQNTTQNLVWSMTKIDGTAVAGGVTLTVAADTLSATLTHANFNTARGASEGVIVKATCDGLSDQISVVRVQAGAAGQSGRSVSIAANTSVVKYPATGSVPTAGGANIVLKATPIPSATGSFQWNISHPSSVSAGAVATNWGATLSTSPGGIANDTLTMTPAQFEAARANWSLEGIQVQCVWTDTSVTPNITVEDRIGLKQVRDGAAGDKGDTGAKGDTGPTLDISAPIAGFKFIDGVLNPANQIVTTSAMVNGVATAIVWNLYGSDGTLIYGPSAAAAIFNCDETNLANYEALVVEGNYQGVKARITLGRLYRQSQASQDTIAYSKSNALDANGTLLNVTADGVLSKTEKKNNVIPEWARIQSSYTTWQAQAAARGVTTEKTAHTNAYNALSTYLTVSTTCLNPSFATAIDLTQFRATFKTYYDAEEALAAACNAKAATTADWGAGVTGTGRPADGATVGDSSFRNGNFATNTADWTLGSSQSRIAPLGADPAYVVGNGSLVQAGIPIPAGLRKIYISYDRWAPDIQLQIANDLVFWDGNNNVAPGGTPRYDDFGSQKTYSVAIVGGTVVSQVPANTWGTIVLSVDVPISAVKMDFKPTITDSRIRVTNFRLSSTFPSADPTALNEKIYAGDYNATAGDNLIRNPTFALNGTVLEQMVLGSNSTRKTPVDTGESGNASTLPAAWIRTTVTDGAAVQFNTTPATGSNRAPAGQLTPFWSFRTRSTGGSWFQIFVTCYKDGLYNGAVGANVYPTGAFTTQSGTTQALPAGTTHYAVSITSQVGSGSWVDIAEPRLAFTEAAATAGADWNSTLKNRPSDSLLLNTEQKYADITDSKPPVDATKGATWGTDLTNKPADELLLNSRVRIDASSGNVRVGYADAAGNFQQAGAVSADSLGVTAAGVAETATKFFGAESGADKTANQQIVVSAPADIQIQCDYNANPTSGQLPTNSAAPVVSKGGVSVRTQATTSYVASFNGCAGSISNNNDATKGVVTITSISTTNAWVDISVTVNGVVVPPVRLYVSKRIPNQPAATPASGGSGTGPSSYTAAPSSVASQSQVTCINPFTVRAGAGGKVNLSVNFDYYRVSQLSATSYLYGQIFYRPTGGTWTQLTADTQAQTAATTYNNSGGGAQAMFVDGDAVQQNPGNLTITISATGLTPGNDYDFELLAHSSNAQSLDISGTMMGTAA